MKSGINLGKKLSLLVSLIMIVLCSYSTPLQKSTDSAWVAIRSIKIANQAIVELKFTKKVDSLQRTELAAKRYETNNLRYEIVKLKENDSLLNQKSILQYKREFLDSNRILELTQAYKQEKKSKIISYAVVTPVAVIIGILIGIFIHPYIK